MQIDVIEQKSKKRRVVILNLPTSIVPKVHLECSSGPWLFSGQRRNFSVATVARKLKSWAAAVGVQGPLRFAQSPQDLDPPALRPRRKDHHPDAHAEPQQRKADPRVLWNPRRGRCRPLRNSDLVSIQLPTLASPLRGPAFNSDSLEPIGALKAIRYSPHLELH